MRSAQPMYSPGVRVQAVEEQCSARIQAALTTKCARAEMQEKGLQRGRTTKSGYESNMLCSMMALGPVNIFPSESLHKGNRRGLRGHKLVVCVPQLPARLSPARSRCQTLWAVQYRLTGSLNRSHRFCRPS